MRDFVYIAWRYLTFHYWRSLTLLLCVSLIVLLPLSLNLLLDETERNLLARANATPLLLGAKGSSLDLVMSSLYFSAEPVSSLRYDEYKRVLSSGLALGIPIYNRYSARGFPIIGTGIEYFEFRKLVVEQGRMLAVLGECVIGANVASDLGLTVGDHLVSSPENAFDLAGAYPLKMEVVGILGRAHTPDDLAVFVDTKTAWIIEGLGHGHQDLQTAPADVLLQYENGTKTANAKLEHFMRITPDNIGSFHFHGASNEYPLTAIIAVPHDDKASTLLRGRYLAEDTGAQIIRPRGVIGALLNEIFRIKNVLDSVLGLISGATVALIGLVFALSWRLRQHELATLFRLGASRLTTVRLLSAEVAIIVLGSALLCAAVLSLTHVYATELIRAFVIR